MFEGMTQKGEIGRVAADQSGPEAYQKKKNQKKKEERKEATPPRLEKLFTRVANKKLINWKGRESTTNRKKGKK